MSPLRQVDPKTILLEFVRALGSVLRFAVILILVRIFNQSSGAGPLDFVFVLLGLLAVVRPLAAYYFIRFGIEGESLIYRVSMISKTEKVIPIDRIQEVEIVQDPIHRLLGLGKVKIDTGAGGGDAVEIDALSRQDADDLRSQILRMKGASATADPVHGEVYSEPPEESIYQAELHHLVVAGLGRNRMWAILGGLYFFGREINGERDALSGPLSFLQQFSRPDQNPAGFALGLLFLVMIGWGFGIATSVIQHWKFHLHSVEGRLVRRSGLLTVTKRSSAIVRIQGVEISQSWFQRFYRMNTLQAGFAAGSTGEEAAATTMLVPLVEQTANARILSKVLPLWDGTPPRWNKVHRSLARRLSLSTFLLWTILAAPAVGVAFVRFEGLVRPIISIWFVLVAVGIWKAIIEARYHAWAMQEELFFVRRGAFFRRSQLVPLSRIQHATWSQSWFQRRLGVGDLSLSTAAQSIVATLNIQQIPFEDAEKIIDKVSARIEELTETEIDLSLGVQPAATVAANPT